MVGRLSSLLNAVGTVSIFGIMALICSDVVGRYIFSSPVLGTTEIAQVAIIFIVFLQLPDSIAKNQLTRTDSLLLALRETRPNVALFLEMLAKLAGLALMGLLAYGLVPHAINDYRQGYYIGTQGLFTLPSWPVKAVIALGAIVSGLTLAISVARQFGSKKESAHESA